MDRAAVLCGIVSRVNADVDSAVDGGMDGR
jgi:hypothetical protein